MPKCTPPDQPQSIVYKGKTCVIPENTAVLIDINSLHRKRAYWGDDVDKFAPQHWDSRIPDSGWTHNGEKVSQRNMPGNAPFCHLREPKKGAFMPFSEGFRSCLGKNFALVEMCAFLAVLLKGNRVEIAKRGRESQEAANDRAKNLLARSSNMVTLLIRREVGVKLVPV